MSNSNNSTNDSIRHVGGMSEYHAQMEFAGKTAMAAVHKAAKQGGASDSKARRAGWKVGTAVALGLPLTAGLIVEACRWAGIFIK